MLLIKASGRAAEAGATVIGTRLEVVDLHEALHRDDTRQAAHEPLELPPREAVGHGA